MTALLAELDACTCCASMIANDDDSECRDYYGHTHPRPSIPEFLTKRLSEQGIDLTTLILVVDVDASVEGDYVFVGKCDLHPEGSTYGYRNGYLISVLGECKHGSPDDILRGRHGNLSCRVCGAEVKS